MTSENGWGGQSVVDRLRRVLVYEPIAPDEHVSWEEFGYFRPIDQDQATSEHAAFRQILTDFGTEVVTAEIGDAQLQDAIFPFDPVIITDQGAILGRMGKELRRREVDLMRETLTDMGIPIAGEIAAPGTFEGGDSFWLDERTLAIGRGYRTNSEGIEQMRAILAPMGVQVITVDLPYWHGPDECLHLLSLISLLDSDLAVVYLPLLTVEFVKELKARNIQLVEIPDQEFPTQGCNVLALEPRRCLVLEENVVSIQRLREAGCEVLTYQGTEISHNRSGGPTCLTRPLLRGNGSTRP
ncbi:MAG: arginine deiminase family protein [Nitrolancea sp.]